MNKKKIFYYSIFYLILMIGVIALYWSGLHGPFLLDDLQTIPLEQMESDITVYQTGPLGRVVTVFTLILNLKWLGTDPFYFKAVNLAIHLLCGSLIGLFTYWLISALPQRRHVAMPTACLITLLWMIHPLQISTVLYVVQRMTALGTLFTLLALCSYLLGRLRQLAHHAHWKPFIFLSIVIFFPLAVFSKEIGLLIPLYLFSIEYFILNFRCPQKKNQYYLTHFYRIFILLFFLLALLYFYHHLSFYLSVYHEKDWSIFSRLLTETKALLFYLTLILSPRLSSMNVYHDDFPLSHTMDTSVIFSFSILLILFLVIFYSRKRAPIIALGLTWFFISHLIESTILPLEAVFDHRNYLASFGILLIPSYYLSYLLISHRFFYQSIALISIASTTIILSTMTWTRSLEWSSESQFLIHAYTDHPHSTRVHLIAVNWKLANQEPHGALDELNKAYALSPDNLGIILQHILMDCNTSHSSPTWLEKATAKIKSSTISPYVIVMLHKLVEKKMHQECQSITVDTVEYLIQEAINNPTVSYRPLYRATLYHLAAGIALIKGDYTRANALFMQSFHAYPLRVDPLIDQAILQSEYGLLKEARSTRALIEKNNYYFNVPLKKIKKLDDILQKKEGS